MAVNKFKWIVFIILGIIFPNLTIGQIQPNPNVISDGRNSSISNDSLGTGLPDSIILQYFKLSDINEVYTVSDTSLDNFFHQYDPVKRKAIDHFNLGNAGSASRPQTFNANPFIGFHTGLRQYDIYNLKLSDFRFFQNNVPHSDVAFTPVSDQQNFIVKSDFSRSFDDGTSISVNYNRIRQEGFYANQTTKITNFGTSLRYQSEDKRYTGFLSFISNVNDEIQNGGVQQDTFWRVDILADRQTVPTRTINAQTRYVQRSYSLVNYYQLNNPDKSKLNLLLRYDLSFDRNSYKFSDVDVTSAQDTIEYGQFLTEGRGIRFSNSVNKTGNAFYSYLTNDNNLNARVGLVYDRYTIDQQGFGSVFDNIYLDFKGNIPIFGGLSIKSNGQLGIGEGIGDFLLKGSLDLDISNWIQLEGGISLYRHTPEMMTRSLVLNGLSFYENEFVKPIGTEFFGKFQIPILNLKGSFKQSIINNSIFYNSEGRPEQFEDIFTATTLTLENNIRWKSIGLNNYLMLQTFSENIYNLPTVFSKHNLYSEFWLFDKVIQSRAGVEFRFQPTHQGADFNPITGNFFQSDVDLGFYPITDIYFTGKLQSFRFFLRFENISNLLNESVQFQTVHYPQYDFKFRFGVSWLLLN